MHWRGERCDAKRPLKKSEGRQFFLCEVGRRRNRGFLVRVCGCVVAEGLLEGTWRREIRGVCFVVSFSVPKRGVERSSRGEVGGGGFVVAVRPCLP